MKGRIIMKLKKVTALALTFIMALSVAACGGKTEEPAAPADTAPAAGGFI